MAVYFDYKIQSPTVAFHKHIACHNNYPLVAVASESEPDSGGSITLYLDEGELLEDSMVQRVAVVTSLSWHPSRKIVTSGWKSGEILIWNEHDHDLHEAVLHHKTPVVILAWNSTGSRLVSGDEAGVLNIWKADQKGRLQQAPMHKHEVNSSITQLVFQLTSGPELAADLAAAARAAVSGDESALDMFSWKKSSSNMKFNMTSADNIQLYFGTVDGNVYGVDDRGKLSSKFKLEGAVRKLLYHESKELIITVTDSFHLSQHGLGEDGEVTEISKVKLSGQPGKGEITWAGPGLIAMVSGEQVVRMLDIEHDESYLLYLEISMGFENGECIGCIAYSPQKRIIAGGTNKGKVAMWKYNPSALDKYNSKGSHGSAGNEKLWELLSPAEVEGTVTALQWGAGKGFLAVNTGTDVVVLNESVMNSHFNQQVGAVQVSPSQMTIEIFSTNFLHDLKTDIHIKGMFVTKNHATIWNGRKVVVYEVAQDKSLIRAVGTFNSDSTHIAVNDQSLYLLEAGKITVRTFQGTTKQELAFTEQEGDPVLMGTCGSFLAIGSNKGVVKMFDLSRREARQHGPAKYFDEIIPNFGHFRTVKNNCNGTKVGVLSAEAGGSIDSKVYVWDIETDSVQNFDFFYGNGPSDIDENLQIAQEQLTADIKDRTARSLFWDPGEPKLLICEAICSGVRRADKGKTEKIVTLQRSKDDTKEDVLIISLFSTPDSGIIVQDHFAMDSEHTGLLGTDIPYFYFARKSFEEDKAGSLSSGSSSVKHLISRRTMRDFIGLENADASTKDAMINFSYLSAVGNMDDAFKAIKAIKSGSVWENMARMCVKTKRLDVAAVCLGNMGNARGAKALREAMSEPELDAKVAALALQLGMHDEAERLYQNCGRHDLLNEFYQASNNWPKAMEEAEMYDRIHLRTTYYNYGKYLESVGNFGGAIQYYEKSETHRFEVPRMLFEDPDQLEAYIMKSKDKQLRKWWAQYMESIGEMETALQFYQSAQDNLALVRVYCYCGNLDKAADICNETGDKAACYHLARQFENQENVKGAIHYFSRAQAYSNGIRLAKENELDNELMNLALLSSPEDMIDAARYFESKAGMHDKAVMLYHKGGRISKAVDLAFRTEQFGALQLISEDLDENTDPEMLNKCAEFFIEHGQFDKAVELLVVGRRYHDALEMCMDHHVNITEDIAEKMTLPKDYEDQQYRTQLLERIAECAFKQGSFHLATKKFTQAGNKLKAMKSLLKSGDTEKIVFFAGVSRQREIYVMAANYLQSLDWRKDPEIMKNIIGFYTKGRALDSLASFYEACAQVEIDEYQNYEKAFGALTEAYKSLSKAKVKNSAQQEERLATLKQKLTLIKKFLQAKKMLVEDPDEAIKQCQLLLDDPDMESSVRLGDAYGLMIEHFVSKQSYKQAYQLMQDLRQRAPSINMAFYVSMKSIEAVHKALDIPLGRGVGAEKTRNGMMNGDTGQDIVDDEVIDESYDAQDDDYI